MALDTRRCFWFGTEERAGFYATPLKGADSSPAAWGVEGTLLNGGGYGFHSFGSHKRYSYEWPQSSSPETAQMMKSYRDGTYGRGLLYFLEPGIYRTNVLPAHWADPSMAINNEAPSLVYNVTPIGIPTSGGDDLGLPVISAQYDLSNTPAQATPTPDTSVFIPVPSGHTLVLGAFYSATGTGGVYATPINSNGTLGTNVKLTQKSNSDTTVVTDQFSGGIKGVRLWVGRTDGSNSSVTIASMIGRLIETADVPVYSAWSTVATNLFTNPLFVGQTNWLFNGATAVVSDGVADVTVGASPLTANFITPSNTAAFTGFLTGEPFSAGYTVRNTWSTTLLLRVAVYNGAVYNYGPTITINPGETKLVSYAGLATPSGASYMQPRLHAVTVPAGATMRVSEPIAVKSSTLPLFFYGGTPSGELERYSWAGVTDASASIHESRTRTGNPAKLSKLAAGPWIGGQGHSGCRFMGTPSYVTNSPIEGGRVGFAASFVEVGSWLYG